MVAVMTSVERIEEPLRFYLRRDARLRSRLPAATSIEEKVLLLKALQRNRRSILEMLKKFALSQKYLDIGGKSSTIKLPTMEEDGGPGSGNHGHKGRPGEQGGSAANGSAEGKNKPCTGFRDKAAERRHKKHWKEFGVTSHADYEKKAIEFIRQPVGGDVDGYLRDEDGAIIRFNTSTGEIGIGIPGGEIITYFKAKFKNGTVNLPAANNYFNAMKKEEQYEQEDGISTSLPSM